jgi:hypothetical protein
MQAPLGGSAALLALLASGCGPFLADPYDAYTTPEATRIIGNAYQIDLLGDYWADDAGGAAAWWGWLAEPQRQLKALELVAPAGVDCTMELPDIDGFLAMLEDPGAAQAVLAGPDGDLTLPWDADDQVYTSELEALPIGAYELTSMATTGAGILQVDGFLRVPKAADVDGLSLDGAEPTTIGLSELDFAWNPTDELAQYVIITVELVDAEQNIIETGTCAAKYANGDINFATNQWIQADSAVGALVTLSTADEAWVEIGERGIAARMLSERRELGYVHLD